MLAAGLRGAQLILLAVCAFLVYATVAPHLSAAPAPRDVRLDSDVEILPTPPLEYYSLIWERSPFGQVDSQVVAATLAKAAPAATSSRLNWRLVTTAAATPPELSVAGLVSTQNGTRRTVRIGDEIGGREVIDIERRRVVFSFNGKLEQLSIDGTSVKTPVRPQARRSAPSRSSRPTTARARLGASRMAREAASRRAAAAEAEEPEAEEPEADAPPATVPGLAPGIASQLELDPDEEIVSVNGLPLGDPELEANLANAGGNLTLTIRAEDGSEREVVIGENE